MANKFIQAIESRWQGYAIALGNSEPFFSWSTCDSCGSTLGGDRSDAIAYPLKEYKTGDDIEISVCVDCLLFHANGDLPENWG